MKHHLEIEYKTLLSQTDYLQLLSEFKHLTPVFQTNYYIDTPDLDLKHKKLALRIRMLEERAELTLKIPQEVGNQEYNQDLDRQVAQSLIDHLVLPEGPIATILNENDIDCQELQIWGNLHTLRYEMASPIGLLALDENTYGDKKDYELEIEVKDASKGEAAFKNYLHDRQIPFQQAQSKVARTAAALKRGNS